YPNPAADQINLELIDFAQWGNSAVTLYNVHGVRLQSINILSSITPINLAHYSSGLYFIEIRQQNGRKYYSKFIKN
ncbi:MAG: T9SS type A sorting domain-containing protein, partial [Bacteroidales bacterium]|nr:T9SS type A sorting domain-containing protein [Bacteroidales bacterium]